MVVSGAKRSPSLREHHGGHDLSQSWPGSEDRDVMMPAYLFFLRLHAVEQSFQRDLDFVQLLVSEA